MPYSPPRHGQKRVDAASKESQKAYNRTRRTGNQFYNSTRWKKNRKLFKQQNPLCVACLRIDRTTPTDVVDHIIPIKKGGAELDWDNLQSLCNLHHNQKTAREKMTGSINVIIGPPCAGKSTFAQDSAKKSGGVIVDFDLLAQAFGSTTAHQASEDIKRITLKARFAAIKEISDGAIDCNAWIIETTPSKKMMSFYKEMGATFHVIDPTEAVCLKRAGVRAVVGTEKRIRHWYLFPPVFDAGAVGVKPLII